MAKARFPYQNPALPLAQRAQDLISRLTLEEKIAQLGHGAPAVARLGLPAYNYWNEALHGVARAGLATVFPQAIGLAATFNPALMERVATAIGDEARAKHHAALRRGHALQYFGLTMWSPNINIFRDPRWGRGHETYGEDPFLTARMGVAFVRGLQGNDPTYLKTAACAKHYAVHSGPEHGRHGFNSQVSLKDLRETYLPAFEALVREARVETVMGAYNRMNGEACCASPTLLAQILRGEWHFDGHVVSDCGALDDIYQHHGLATTPAAAAAASLKAGCDLNCGCTYVHLLAAVQQGLASEADVDTALTRVLSTRLRLGMFDPPARVPYAKTPMRVVDSPAHRALALQAARESIVLLKNNGVLPLSRQLNHLIVTGPNVTSADVLLGNYNGFSSRHVTPLEGLVAAAGPATNVTYLAGCDLLSQNKAGFQAISWYAPTADAFIAIVGLSPRIEGEEGDAADSDAGGDRRHLQLPGVQEDLLKELKKLGKPVIVVLTAGSSVALTWAQEHADAVVCLWYPGEEGGTALAEVLYGDYAPAGRLPVTFYTGVEQLPPFGDYAMTGRTYRYFAGEPLYPFGFGLSYTRFSYGALRVAQAAVGVDADLAVEVDVTNTGSVASDEVVQLYLSVLDAPVTAALPRAELRGIQRLTFAPGECRTVRFVLTPAARAWVNDAGQRCHTAARYRVEIGACSPGARGRVLGAPAPAVGEFCTVG